MKLLIVLLAVLGVSTAATLPAGKALDRNTRDLQDTWNEFKAVAWNEKMSEILTWYLANDAEVQAISAWLRSDECNQLLQTVVASDKFTTAANHFQTYGVDLVAVINHFLSYLGHDDLLTSTDSASRVASTRYAEGVLAFLSEIYAAMDIDGLRTWHTEKYETNTTYAAFVDWLKSEECQAVMQELKDTDYVQKIVTYLRDLGVDVDYYVAIVIEILGW